MLLHPIPKCCRTALLPTGSDSRHCYCFNFWAPSYHIFLACFCVVFCSLGAVLLLIGGTFLVCHTPKNILNVYELYRLAVEVKLSQLRQLCLKAHCPTTPLPYPIWASLLTAVSHLLLIINASSNIFIYFLKVILT